MDTWHPMYSAVEPEPGVWTLSTQYGEEYGRIELRRVGPDAVRYKAQHRGELLGWAASLRTACERVHKAELASMGRPGGPRGHSLWGRAAAAD